MTWPNVNLSLYLLQKTPFEIFQRAFLFELLLEMMRYHFLIIIRYISQLLFFLKVITLTLHFSSNKTMVLFRIQRIIPATHSMV